MELSLVLCFFGLFLVKGIPDNETSTPSSTDWSVTTDLSSQTSSTSDTTNGLPDNETSTSSSTDWSVTVDLSSLTSSTSDTTSGIPDNETSTPSSTWTSSTSETTNGLPDNETSTSSSTDWSVTADLSSWTSSTSDTTTGLPDNEPTTLSSTDWSVTADLSSWTSSTSDTTGVTTTQSSADESSTAHQSSSASSTSDTTKESWLFGLSSEMSVIILAGLCLILVLLFLLVCVVCYKLGKSKSFSVIRESMESSEHWKVDKRSGLPTYLLSYTKTSTTKTGIQFVRPVNLDLPGHSDSLKTVSTVSPRANAFVYRPFENRSSLTSYDRRQDLVRVESP